MYKIFIVLLIVFPLYSQSSFPDMYKEMKKMGDEFRKDFVRETEITDEDEILAGKTLSKEVSKQYKNIKSGRDYQRVREIFENTVKFKQRKRIPISIFLISSQEINAFAVAGGSIWITSGLMGFIETDDELAGIIGHEISHIDYKHCQKSIQAYISILKKTDDEDIADIGQTLLSILNIPYSQDQETEADYYAVQLSNKAGYDSKRYADFFERLEKKYKIDRGRKDVHPDIDKLMNSHPMNLDRAAKIKKNAAKLLPRKLASNSEMKKEIQNLDIGKITGIIILAVSLIYIFYKLKTTFKK